MSSLVNFFNGMNISDTGATVPSQARTASATIKPQRRFAISVPTTRSSSRTSKPIGSKRKLESCVICLQNCTSTSSAKPDGCDHAVCDTCLRAYYQSALTDTRYHSFEHIQCANPDCEALFVSEKVIRNIFTAKQRDDWWTTATMKTFIENKVCCLSLRDTLSNDWMQVECPFGDCKAIFDADVKLTKKCTFAECYECRRGVCTACQSSWHPGIFHSCATTDMLYKKFFFHRSHQDSGWWGGIERDVARGQGKILDEMPKVPASCWEKGRQGAQWCRSYGADCIPTFKNGCNTMLCKCGTEL